MLEFFCANNALGKVAASYFSSPVYIGVIWQPPERPVYAMAPGSPPCIYPFHGWGIMVSTYAWKMFAEGPNSLGGQVYSPTPNDFDLGKLLQDQFYAFMATGIAPNMKQFNQASGFPNNYTLAVIGNEKFSSQI